MTKLESERTWLRTVNGGLEAKLVGRSGLPGPRANLELARAVAEEGDRPLFEQLAAWSPTRAPDNDPRVFLTMCGVLGLGRLVVEGNTALLARLRTAANDPRWRVREAVAMALQQIGRARPQTLADTARDWASGTPLERRAAVAGLCEPDVLTEPEVRDVVLDVLGVATASLTGEPVTRDPALLALRRTLGYAWSVAVVALWPDAGDRFTALLDVDDRHVQWIVRENLRKDRLRRLDAGWVETLRQRT